MTLPQTPTQAIGQLIVAEKYSRLLNPYAPTSGKETWEQVIERYFSTFYDRFPELKFDNELNQVKASCLAKKIAGSMRGLQYGGKAAIVNNARLYNCWTIYVRETTDVFANILWLLLSGGGVGFSVFKKDLATLPRLVTHQKLLDKKRYTGNWFVSTVADTIEGWADSIKVLLAPYFVDDAPYAYFDYSKIRPAGAPLITSGGVAPSYQGLRDTHDAIRKVIEGRMALGGHQLTSVDVLDIICHLAEAVLSGGNRRSALLAAFDRDDEAMRQAKTPVPVKFVDKFYTVKDGEKIYAGEVFISFLNPAKSGQVVKIENERDADRYIETKAVDWWVIEKQRQRVNISAVYQRGTLTKEEVKEVLDCTRQWGEPAFIFADDARTVVNPCGEIAMMPELNGEFGAQACNLTSINVGKCDTREDFLLACEQATILGTLQAAFTDFSYLNDASEEITRDEALLGVSLTGVLNRKELLLDDDGSLLREGAELVIKTNKEWAKKLGINPAARLTTIKPDGTVVFPFETFASGIHPAHSHKFFRRVRINKHQPVYKVMKEANPMMVEDDLRSNTDAVFTFPIQLSGKEMVKADLTAVEHLKIINFVYQNWVKSGVNPECNKKSIVSNNVSCTVVVNDDEWDEVGNFLFEHQESMGAVSFMGNFKYDQPPFESVETPEHEELFAKLLSNFKPVDFFNLRYEAANETGKEMAACAGGLCEII